MSPYEGRDADIVSKTEFAALSNVTPGRVSQWISERKIHGDALVGEGRSARIRASVARLQLRRAIDIGQRLGNGLATNLDGPLAPSVPVAESQPGTALPHADPLEEQIKRERLEQLQRQNRRAEREEAESAGRLTDAELARQQMGRVAAQVIATFDAGIADAAMTIAGAIQAAIAEKRELTQRDIMHLLRGEQRKIRAAAAAAMKRGAADMPLTVEFDLGQSADEPPAAVVD